jgi:hypothetical protein
VVFLHQAQNKEVLRESLSRFGSPGHTKVGGPTVILRL